MRNLPLTERQRAVISFVYESIESRGWQPSYREIGAQFGIRSPNGVRQHVVALAKKGYVKTSSSARGLELLKRPDGSPFAAVVA